jgi:putative ABC transport system permease protein
LVAAVGAAAGVSLFTLGRALIGMWRPQFLILLTGQTIARALVAALAMALVAALLPARRLARLDPAVAFRSTP